MKSRIQGATKRTSKPPDVLVRLAHVQDVPRLLPLFCSYLRFYRVPAIPRKARTFLSERLRRREAVMFLAERGDHPAGFLLLYPSFCSLEQRPIWILYDLFVDPKHRRAGLARLLMDTARLTAEASGACRIELSTAHANRQAQKLYESIGYQRDHRFAHYQLTTDRRTT